jgi:hypothetical protein
MSNMSKYMPKPILSPKMQVLSKPKYSVSPPENKIEKLNNFCKKLDILDDRKKNQVKLDFASGYVMEE